MSDMKLGIWNVYFGPLKLGRQRATPAVLRCPKLVDWPTIAALTGLLILTKGVELSGYLDRLALRMARTCRRSARWRCFWC
ncbi:MAG: hypothetical protein ACR2FI_12415 [Burkholderiales bacterium]|nr:hypothetical protein [Pseudomonadota bacterium]